MGKRKSTGKRLRFEIFKRDGFRCMYCGATPMQKVLRVDHVVPVAGGGDSDPSNLITACFDCNAGKSATPLDDKKLKAGIATESDREHAEQIREWLSIQRDVGEARDEVVEAALGEWTRRLETSPDGFRPRLRKMIDEFGLPRLVEAFDIVERNVKQRRENDQVRYLYGVLRRWRNGGEAPTPAPASPPQSAHQQRALSAVCAAVAEINAAPEKFPSAQDRKKHAYLAFARAAFGSAEDFAWADDAAETDNVTVRGLSLGVIHTKDGRLSWKVEDCTQHGSDHRIAYEELSDAASAVTTPLDTRGAFNLEAIPALYEKLTELSHWLAIREGDTGQLEYLRKHRADMPFVKRWGLV